MPKTDDIRVAWIATGQTAWDADGRVVGAADLPLSATGERQVRELAGGFERGDLGVVLCGPDEASEQTARTMAEATGAKVKVVDGLAEVGLGLWEGLRTKEAEEKFATSFRQWIDDPSSVTPPSGEAMQDADERIVSSIARALLRTKGEHAVGVVLRPLAGGLVRCWRRAVPSSRLRECLNEAQELEWDTVRRESLKRQAAD